MVKKYFSFIMLAISIYTLNGHAAAHISTEPDLVTELLGYSMANFTSITSKSDLVLKLVSHESLRRKNKLVKQKEEIRKELVNELKENISIQKEIRRTTPLPNELSQLIFEYYDKLKVLSQSDIELIISYIIR